MNYRYLLPLLALSGATVAQAQEQNEGSGQTIVVTGTSLSQTERNLRDCLARNCPPDQDIAATLAHAEKDRKSTRLNSSHGYISYAVFCLKKKKKKIKYTPRTLIRT